MVGLVFSEKQFRSALAVQTPFPQLVVACLNRSEPRAFQPVQTRLWFPTVPTPGIPEPQRRQQVKGSCLGTAVCYGDAHQDVFDTAFGILDKDIEIAVLVEDSRVNQ